MNICICVGSSCHLKGSYEIIKHFQQLVELHHLEERVTLSASFCLGHCTQGVALKIDDEFIDGVSPENAEAVFERFVLSYPCKPGKSD
jgi:NADH:ubiquinone oxidoreductase subunit E